MQKPKYSVSLYDLVLMYTNVYKAAKTPDVGYNNADKTLEQLTQELKNQSFRIDQDALEDALWACNSLGASFFSPKDGQTFNEWMKEAFSKHGFIYYEQYGWIKEIKDNGK